MYACLYFMLVSLNFLEWDTYEDLSYMSFSVIIDVVIVYKNRWTVSYLYVL